MKIFNNKEFANLIANQEFNDLVTKYTWTKKYESISVLINSFFKHENSYYRSSWFYWI